MKREVVYRGASGEPTSADALATQWARARREDGWVDFAQLGIPRNGDGSCVVTLPPCGAMHCTRYATALDPAGVGWCARHLDGGLFVPPRLERAKTRR